MFSVVILMFTRCVIPPFRLGGCVVELVSVHMSALPVGVTGLA